MRKTGSTLQPLIIDVTLPVAVEEEAIDEVRLLIGKRNAAIIDESVDYEVTDNNIRITWYETEETPLPYGSYRTEVWIYSDGKVFKTPSTGYGLLRVTRSLQSQSTE
jgi:hypothetical protein